MIYLFIIFGNICKETTCGRVIGDIYVALANLEHELLHLQQQIILSHNKLVLQSRPTDCHQWGHASPTGSGRWSISMGLRATTLVFLVFIFLKFFYNN